MSAPTCLIHTIAAFIKTLCLCPSSMISERHLTQGDKCGSLRAGVWIANTVGLCNYKAFLLFLFYTFWACALAAAMLLSEVVHFFKGLGHSRAGEVQQARIPG